jgi:cytochrome P450
MDLSDFDSTTPPRAEPYEIGSTDDSLPRMMQDFAKHGDLYCVHAPDRKRDTWTISDPQDIKRVLLTNHRNYNKGVGFERVKLLLGNGIIVSDGSFWQRQRRMMQPAFQRAAIDRQGAMMAEINLRRLARWDQLADSGEPLNVTKELSELSLDIVLRALFGADIDELIRTVGHNPFSMVTDDSARDLKFAYRFRQLTKHVEGIILRRQQSGAPPVDDWLGTMIAARDTTGNAMTMKELLDEVFSLIVAGHETTAGTLNWSWYLLSQNPEVEAQLHAELDAAEEFSSWQLTAIEGLHYTQQVLLEALRLYPPVWVFTRRAVKEDQLSGCPLAADTDVFISPYVVHRHPEHWPEPESFCPARFAADADPKPPKFAYVPFSAGPRHCIGESFAMYEMGIHLYLAARRFRLRYTGKVPPDYEARINLRTREDLQMIVERR